MTATLTPNAREAAFQQTAIEVTAELVLHEVRVRGGELSHLEALVDRRRAAGVRVEAVGGAVHRTMRRLDDNVGPECVMALRDVCKEEGALKGFLVTNGIFAAPAAQMLEAQKLELVNGPTLLKLLAGTRPA